MSFKNTGMSFKNTRMSFNSAQCQPPSVQDSVAKSSFAPAAQSSQVDWSGKIDIKDDFLYQVTRPGANRSEGVDCKTCWEHASFLAPRLDALAV